MFRPASLGVIFLFLLGCQDQINSASSSSSLTSLTSSSSRAWKLDSNALSWWKKSPVWLCHNVKDSTEGGLLEIQFEPNHSARIRINPLGISDARGTWNWQDEILNLQVLKRSYSPKDSSFKTDTIKVDLWWDFDPINSAPQDSISLVQLDEPDFEWSCGASESMD